MVSFNQIDNREGCSLLSLISSWHFDGKTSKLSLKHLRFTVKIAAGRSPGYLREHLRPV
jgi:hypothetical protein